MSSGIFGPIPSRARRKQVGRDGCVHLLRLPAGQTRHCEGRVISDPFSSSCCVTNTQKPKVAHVYHIRLRGQKSGHSCLDPLLRVAQAAILSGTWGPLELTWSWAASAPAVVGLRSRSPAGGLPGSLVALRAHLQVLVAWPLTGQLALSGRQGSLSASRHS